MKKIKVWITLVLLITLISGCGSAPASSSSSTEEASSPEPTSEAVTPETKTIGGELEVAAFSNGDLYDDFFETAVKEFNALYPDCKVTLVTSANIEEQMRPRFVSGNAPDIYFMGGNANMDEAAFTAQGMLMDLTEWFETAEAIGYDGLIKDNMGAKVFNKTDKGIFGMALGYGGWGYLYNVNMAKEYGWEPPKNWAEFEALAKTIKETTDIYPIIHQGTAPDYFGFGLVQGGIATDGGKEALLAIGNLEENAYDQPAVKSTWDKLQEIYENDWSPQYCMSLSPVEAQMEWLQGKAFILPCGNWIEGEMAENWPEGFKAGFMYSCMYDDASAMPQIIGYGARVSVSANTKNPDAALAFMQVLFSKNMTRKVAEDFGTVPCMRDSLDGFEFPNSTKELMDIMNRGEAEMIVEIGGQGNFQPYAELSDADKQNVAAVLSGEKTADQARKDMNGVLAEIAGNSSIEKISIS